MLTFRAEVQLHGELLDAGQDGAQQERVSGLLNGEQAL